MAADHKRKSEAPISEAGASEAAILRALDGNPELSARERSSLYFAAAALLDRAGRYDEAFEHASRAHALRNAEYDPARLERVVENLEEQARRMIEFLDLPWDERCLRFYENPRPVATASRAQVRTPIYRASVGRWRHYDRHLGPLRDALAGGVSA